MVDISSKLRKKMYRELCETEKTIPIFSQSWWLDSVIGDASWNVCLVIINGEIIASMPYVLKKRLYFTLCTMPALTQNLGPWIRPSMAKNSTQLAQQKDLMSKLIEQLPSCDYFLQNWHYSQTNWLPFYWKSYQQTTRYTYVVDNLSDLSVVWSEFSSSYRNKIRKAEKIVKVYEDMDIDDFFEINNKTFSRQKTLIPYSKKFLVNHDSVLSQYNARKIFYAQDKQDNIHSALYLVWDKQSSYVHLVGEDPLFRNSGAGILLIWYAMKYTQEVLNLNLFDFEGSMIEGVERVRRGCGAKQKPYYTVSKTSTILLRMRMAVLSLTE